MSKALVLFGTLTYNTEMVAQKVYETVEQSGRFEETVLMNVIEIFDPSELENYDFIIMGTSTWGEGDYPPDMEEFVTLLQSSSINLADKPVAIFGLGETIYEQFCGAAKNLEGILKDHFNVKMIGEIFTIDGYPEEEVFNSVGEWTNQVLTLV